MQQSKDEIKAKYCVTLKPDTILHHVATSSSDAYPNRFYSYWRDPTTVVANPYLQQKIEACKTCRLQKYVVTEELTLLVLPYDVLYANEVTDYDTSLADVIENSSPSCTPLERSAITSTFHLDRQQQAKDSKVNPDYIILERVCNLGYHGFLRIVNGPPEGASLRDYVETSIDKTDPYDEIALCGNINDTFLTMIEEDSYPGLKGGGAPSKRALKMRAKKIHEKALIIGQNSWKEVQAKKKPIPKKKSTKIPKK